MCAKLFDLDLLTPTCTGSYAGRPTSSLNTRATESLGKCKHTIRCTYNETAGLQRAHHSIFSNYAGLPIFRTSAYYAGIRLLPAATCAQGFWLAL
jgi:hypothetical protein